MRFFFRPLKLITVVILTTWLCAVAGASLLANQGDGGSGWEETITSQGDGGSRGDGAVTSQGDGGRGWDFAVTNQGDGGNGGDGAVTSQEDGGNDGDGTVGDLASATGDAVAGEYIIKFKPGVAAQTKAQLLDKYALDKQQSFKTINAQVVKMPARMRAMSESSLLEELASDPAIEYIEPNYRLYPMKTRISEDAGAAYLWGLKNYGQIINGVAGTPGIDINLQPAWHITQGDPEVLVAVIDSGVDIFHPDLVDAIWRNPGEIAGNGVDDDGNGFVDDVYGWDFCNDDNSVYDSPTIDKHGTHCAGAIAAARNLIGVVGVAPGVKILPLKFMNASGGDTAHAIAAIEYAQAAGAKIVNCSWGGSDGSLALHDAIADSGMLFIAAAGNALSGKPPVNIDISPLYPASFALDNIIAVAAINNRGNLASFSYYGPNTVDVAAPGEYIYSTIPENKYAYLSGTSMATAYVSGIAALAMSAGYTDNAVIKQRILDSALLHPLPGLSGKVLTGGLVDATAAAEIEMTPEALDLNISGEMYAGQTIQAVYTYFDVNDDLEEGTQLQWYRGRAADKSDGLPIDGAFNLQYGLTSDDVGQYLYFSVTPSAASGLSPGETVYSDVVGPVEVAHLASLQILHEGENLLDNYSSQQYAYNLTVETALAELQILFTEVGGCDVTLCFNDVPLEGNLITPDDQRGTLTVRVEAPETAERTYTVTISWPDNCFIATAAFGSKYAPAVKMLRSFRDDYLLTISPGRSFVAFYYHHSPSLAGFIADHEGLRTLTRALLTPLIAGVYLLYHQALLAALATVGTVLVAVRFFRRMSAKGYLIDK